MPQGQPDRPERFRVRLTGSCDCGHSSCVSNSGIKAPMKNVGAQCSFLRVSPELKTCLQQAGQSQSFAPGEILFREDGDSAGVFLLIRGKISMSVYGMPKLDRLFSAGSLLGLPSTFTGRPYSLTAQAVTDADVVHVVPEPFLQIMRERPQLCREATEMLGREVTFIQSALAERRKQATAKKSVLDGLAITS